MIDLPLNCECIGRITFNKSSSIQKIKLSRVEEISSNLPNGTQIEVLSYKDGLLKWKGIDRIKLKCRNKVPMQLVSVKKMGFSIAKPIDQDFKLVCGIGGMLQRTSLSVPTFLLGLAGLENYEPVRIEYVRSGKNRKATLQTFLHNFRRRYETIPYSVFFKDKELDALDYVKNINDMIYDYSMYQNMYLADVYLTELLLRNGILNPLIFNKGFDALCVLSSNVPYHLNWLLYLMYGDTHRVSSKIKYKTKFIEFCIPELEFKLSNWTMRMNKLQLSLKDDYQLVLINNNLPMVYE